MTTHACHLAGFNDGFEDPLMMVVAHDDICSVEDRITDFNWRNALDEIFVRGI